MVPIWVPHCSAIGNRLLKPIYKAIFGQTWITSEIWDGIVMEVNPSEAIGGNLYFSSHLYDRDERTWIAEMMGNQGTFVDVGANIGAYSLWAHSCMKHGGRIVAIEADPENFQVLRGNLKRNGVAEQVIAINMGVSDAPGSLTFYRNTRGNNGGNSFQAQEGNEPIGDLPVRPLHEILVEAKVLHVDFMKMDIEGFELRALTRFFVDCVMPGPDLRPSCLLVELDEGPRGNDRMYREQLMGLLAENDYACAKEGKNALFVRTASQASE